MNVARTTRDLPGFNLRIPADLKSRLKKEARINGRSLTAEIIHRLKMSLDQQEATQQTYKVSEGGAREMQLNSTEESMLTIFKRLPASKQLALLSLLV